MGGIENVSSADYFHTLHNEKAMSSYLVESAQKLQDFFQILRAQFSNIIIENNYVFKTCSIEIIPLLLNIIQITSHNPMRIYRRSTFQYSMNG